MPDHLEAGHRFHGVPGQDRHGVGTLEGRLTHQHLIQHAGQAVLVGTSVYVVSAYPLFGAHVVRGADRHPGLGQFVAPRFAHRPRDTEIRHQGMAFLEQDVFRLDVAVNDVAGMGALQRVGDLAGELDRLAQGQLFLPVQPGPQRLPFDERHDVVEEAGGLAGVVQGQNIGMLQVGRDPDLPEEPVGADRGRQLRPQNLDRHRPIVPGIERQVHGGHASLADQPLDGIAPVKCGT